MSDCLVADCVSVLCPSESAPHTTSPAPQPVACHSPATALPLSLLSPPFPHTNAYYLYRLYRRYAGGGWIFNYSSATIKSVMSRGRYGAKSRHFLDELTPDKLVFFWNFDTNQLHGVFTRWVGGHGG